LARSEYAIVDQEHGHDFAQRLAASMRRETVGTTITTAKGADLYVCGDPAESVYFVRSGQFKLVVPSPAGRECLLAIHTAGDVFGELCLVASGARVETATAMQDSVVTQLASTRFLNRLSGDSLLEGFVQYLAKRVSQQQQTIASLMTVDSEQRLGAALLQLARKIGVHDPRSMRIRQKITHQDLASMVGTTRPRITKFMQKFKQLGLIEFSAEQHLIVREQMLGGYLAREANGK
jgi:CRP/FNR family cyclic AMP-dependent transcriptional regulator